MKNFYLEWVIKCCKCEKEHRERAVTTDLIFDSDPVPVKLPKAKGFHTDGLGGWMCDQCHKQYTESITEA